MPNEAQTQAVYFVENEGIIFGLEERLRWKTAPTAAYHPAGQLKDSAGKSIESLGALGALGHFVVEDRPRWKGIRWKDRRMPESSRAEPFFRRSEGSPLQQTWLGRSLAPLVKARGFGMTPP